MTLEKNQYIYSIVFVTEDESIVKLITDKPLQLNPEDVKILGASILSKDAYKEECLRIKYLLDKNL